MVHSAFIREFLSNRLVGQDEAIETILPLIQASLAGLAPEYRPMSVMLLGPTGTGKTHTVETVAEALHGSKDNLLKINCGEFQLEHEVAKLIGAPPGYIGHKETQCLLAQHKLNKVASDHCNIKIILFDEIEKAASSFNRLLLGILDKGKVLLGDGTHSVFSDCLIFFTSNLGSAAMQKQLNGGFGLSKMAGEAYQSSLRRLDQISQDAVKRRFSPELVNRIDAFVTYKPLDAEQIRKIVDLELSNLAAFMRKKLALRSPLLRVSQSARSWLADKGVSREYGARELKRVIQKHITFPLCSMIEDGLAPATLVEVTAKGDTLKVRKSTRKLTIGEVA